MALTPEQEKKLLAVLLAVLVLAVLYRVTTAEKTKTKPLAHPRGSVAASPVRQGIASPDGAGDPLQVLLARRDERFPGVSRDIFRMENPAPKPPPKPALPVAPLPPPVPEKTPEQIAAEHARADLSKFRFLGYLAEEKNSSLFLSKDGELFIVKSGDTVLKNYVVKETGKDYVILRDTITTVEVRVELSGGGDQGAGPALPRGR
jgi:hypothetical protein